MIDGKKLLGDGKIYEVKCLESYQILEHNKMLM
jgi:hypothetical protein